MNENGFSEHKINILMRLSELEKEVHELREKREKMQEELTRIKTWGFVILTLAMLLSNFLSGWLDKAVNH